jgi:hypothetical protein
MDKMYVMREDLDDFVLEHLPSNKDIFSIQDLIDVIEELNYELNKLKEEMEYENDYPQEEYDRERYYEMTYGEQ